VTPLEFTGSRIASEAAARILFAAVRWVKSVPSFRCLSDADQRVLLQSGWRDLFLLTAAQYTSAFHLRPLPRVASHLPGQHGSIQHRRRTRRIRRRVCVDNEVRCVGTYPLLWRFELPTVKPN